MLSFKQFLAETVPHERKSRMHNKFGFIHPNGKVVTAKRNEHDHDDLAKRLGFNHADHAVHHGGMVRFFHNPKADYERTNEDSEAGYEFKGTPENKKLVSDHLGKSGGFRKIYMDIWRPKPTKNPDGSIKPIDTHQFNSVEAARKHLDEETIVEVRRKAPDGSYHRYILHNGKLHMGREGQTHQDLQNEHGIDEHWSDLKRGAFTVNHKTKSTNLLHYNFGKNYEVDSPTRKDIARQFRKKLKVPKHYKHFEGLDQDPTTL